VSLPLVNLVDVALPVPVSLTPSKVATFKDCALAFRFSVIEGLREPPTPQAFKGTVVHRALELLMWEERPVDRTIGAGLSMLDRALGELLAGDEGTTLGLAGEALDEFVEDARGLVRNYFELEDPSQVRMIGTELLMQVDMGAPWRHGGALAGVSGSDGNDAGLDGDPVASWAGSVRLRGIIDRLELDAEGELVVTDYKTGRAPGQSREQTRLGGVHFYAFLCEKMLGRRPARIQLLHLREPVVIATTPSEQSIAGLELQAGAIWDAIRRACLFEDFRPKPGLVCERCAFHAYCPAMGGDISLARASRQEELVFADGADLAEATGGAPAEPALPLRAAG
jgi:putative RecB family exonuclease